MWFNRYICKVGQCMRINKKIIIIMFALVLAGSPCSFAIDDTAKIQQTEAQTIKVKKGATLSLNDCIAIALNNSPAIKNAQYDYNISKSQVSIARSEFFPTIGVGAGYDFDSIHAKRIKTNTNSYNLNASMNMLLFNFGKTNARISMQKFYMIADEYNFYNAVREITFNVKQKYYQVLAARAGVLINEAYVDINERNYQRTKAYYDEGLKSKIDLVNAEVTLSDSKIGLIKSQTTYEKSLVSLNNAMYLVDAPSYNISEEGVNLNDIVAPVDLTRFQKITSKEDDKTPQAVSDAKFTSAVEKLELLTDYKIEKFPYTFDECIDMAKKNRADLKAYEATVDAIEQNLKYIKRNYYPEISAGVGYALRDSNKTELTNSFNAGVGISSSLNIMAQKNQVDIGKYQVNIAKNTLEQLQKDIYFQVQNAYILMLEAEKQIPLQAVKVRQTRENYELAEGRYYVGLGDYIQLQDAKVNYNNAQHSYIESIYNYNVAIANLESVIAMPQRVTKTLEGKKNGRKK